MVDGGVLLSQNSEGWGWSFLRLHVTRNMIKIVPIKSRQSSLLKLFFEVGLVLKSKFKRMNCV